MTEIVSDVVIVGGGIMGASAAFFLTRRGHRVSLLEREFIGSQASGVNFGNVRRQGRPLMQLPLANRSIETWRRMLELTGEDVEYLQCGHIRVCYRDQPAQLENMEHYARDARDYGLELEVLSGAALQTRFPFLGPEVLAGSYSAHCGHANPRLAAPAFARAARRLGAQVAENTAVTTIDKPGTDFQVETHDGSRYRAPVLLITAGAWSHWLTERFGEPVPLSSLGPTMAVTEPVPYSVRPCVGVFTPVEMQSVYFRQIPRGNVIMGGSMRGPTRREEYRANVQPTNTLNLLREIQRLAPALRRLNIIRSWTGVESYLPDDLPVIGPSSRVNGLFYAFGFSGSGFQLGPGVGETLAELIATGRTDIPLAAYDMRRFQSNPPTSEIARCAD